jgi:hypothetical protein
VPACPPGSSCIPSIGATHVTLEAGYISVSGNSGSTFTSVVPTLADGTLTLKGTQGIDLVGTSVVKNAGTVNVVSDGDVRLIGTTTSATVAGVTSDGYGGIPWVGAFVVADNPNITAREIYPATGTAYLLMSLGLAPAGASGTHNTITFASSGATPVTPLSAGGALIVDAKSIVQGGALYAPLGTIQLGFGSGQSLPGRLHPVWLRERSLRSSRTRQRHPGPVRLEYHDRCDGQCDVAAGQPDLGLGRRPDDPLWLNRYRRC